MTPEGTAINRIRVAAEIAESKGNALVVAYSGGKDSDVLLELATRSGVPFRVEHNFTTADAPPTVYHIRRVFGRLAATGIPCKINFPDEIRTIDGKIRRASMWNLIPKHGLPPTRKMRYCCRHLKERRFENQHLMFGIRWDESTSRDNRGTHETLAKKKENRLTANEDDGQLSFFGDNRADARLTEVCAAKGQIVTNPIIDWSDGDVWKYAELCGIEMNPLYRRAGFYRVGCVGCPMARKGVFRDFATFPAYKAAYLRAFGRMLEERKWRGPTTRLPWRTAEDVFNWWTDPKRVDGQMEMDFEEDLRL
ncbi:MAG: phosphoadenosine phosphosulfate reductase family protein [Clostridiales Family XIII bacterium]|jgi:phosphoadenosine phosphosulfate reductase|nr:phosphoadenosine phosphosulfate reductase family protein [Clostridiales Family XIII bacterium]